MQQIAAPFQDGLQVTYFLFRTAIEQFVVPAVRSCRPSSAEETARLAEIDDQFWLLGNARELPSGRCVDLDLQFAPIARESPEPIPFALFVRVVGGPRLGLETAEVKRIG